MKCWFSEQHTHYNCNNSGHYPVLYTLFKILRFKDWILSLLRIEVGLIEKAILWLQAPAKSKLYSASHSRVAPKMLVYKKNKSTIHLHVIPVMKCGCVFCEFAKRKLATRKDKIKIIKSLPLALSVSREERCEVLECFHVVVKMYRYSLEERVHCEDLLDYWFH
jgi:hypothetical protein